MPRNERSPAEYEKEELLRNVFRKARQKAKEELGQQLSEFQVKRQVGLGTLYGPADHVIARCHADKQQEQSVVERLLCERLRALAAAGSGAGCPAPPASPAPEAQQALLAAAAAAALGLLCRLVRTPRASLTTLSELLSLYHRAKVAHRNCSI